eukprot:2782097-Lingulodinium_polyedra.AAC.1
MSNFNQFHGGSKVSFVEIIGTALKVESEWQAWRTLNTIPTRGTGENSIEKVCWRWIQQNHPNKIKSYNLFQMITSLAHVLKKRGVFEDVMTAFNESVNFQDPTLDTITVITNLHTLAKEVG